MAAHIVVVHDDPTFLHPLATALRDAGHEVDACDDPMAAWDALAEDRSVAALITPVRFPRGPAFGLALAHRARANHPDILIVFTAAAEMKPDTEGLGVFLSVLIGPSAVARVVDDLLRSPDHREGDTC